MLADRLDDFEHASTVGKIEGVASIAAALKTVHCVVPWAVRATIQRARETYGIDVTADPAAN